MKTWISRKEEIYLNKTLRTNKDQIIHLIRQVLLRRQENDK